MDAWMYGYIDRCLESKWTDGQTDGDIDGWRGRSQSEWYVEAESMQAGQQV